MTLTHDAAAERRRRSWAALALAGTALAIGVGLAWSHPVWPRVVAVVFVVAAMAASRYPRAWTWAVPAALPAIALAPWSGALAFEELDLAVLAAAAGGYAARWPARTRDDRSIAPLGMLLIVAFGASWAASVWRGLDDAGGLTAGWLDGYYDPGNTLRVAKSVLWAALLLPLWHASRRRFADGADSHFATGIATGLAVAGVVVVAERYAFTGLTNFSTDYRVTGPFWEMHTGGAALDGFLALAVPWVAWLALRAARPWQGVVVAALAALAWYVALVTFSRAVYLAIPAGLAVYALVHARQGPRSGSSLLRGAVGAAVLAAVAAAAAWLVFRSGGYRTLAASLGVLAASLALGPALRGATLRDVALAVGVGLAAMLPGIALANALPKGPYALFALAFVLCCALAVRAHCWPRPPGWPPALAALVFLAAAAVFVARHWGGAPAFGDAAIVVIAWLAALAFHAAGPGGLLPATRRGQAAVLVLVGSVAGVVAVMTGGAYMTDRLASVQADLDARARHWSDTIGMLGSPGDWVLGQGFGRFPPHYLFNVPDGPHPGGYQVTGNAGRAWLVLAGPRHSASFGEMLRVGQWTTIAPGRQRVSLSVRAEREALLHVEICDRHLLYNAECAIGKLVVKPEGPTWRHTEIELDAGRLPSRRWLLPAPVFFALAVENERGRVEVTDVGLTGADDTQRIANGTFEAGMARWFSISERHHLPWHAKSLPLHVLFEQGLLGLLAFAMLVAAAVWRVAMGRARHHPLAPALAASIAGFLVVGVFDSLLDAPRVAFLFWLLVVVAVTLPAPPRRGVAASAPA